ncbi:hypothetical protein [Bacillus solimangrovi]|uniref:Uncharacterized protein n=1 Tax=Bacillus solimangrovi TaxID=1305675 RepID=A0A1E5LAT5_9BACI|nr:hypothetical protein [Bacillus solimangrovi]OEH91109.1 hypothetical protein BFG57_06985 [Bacillus solimangrovi]
MGKKLSVASVIIFLISVAIYAAVLFGYFKTLFVTALIIIPMIGLIIAIFSERGIYRKIGIIGNSLIVFVVLIMPIIVVTFFWNEP